jgi:hypothetical protein
VCTAIFVVNEALSWLMTSTFGISDLLLLLLRDGWVHHHPFSLPLGLIPIFRLFWVVFCLL